MKLIIVLTLVTQSFIIAMDSTSLVKNIKDDKKTYMTFGFHNPVVKNLVGIIEELEKEQKIQLKNVTATTFAPDETMKKTISALIECRILLNACMREIKERNDAAQEAQEQYAKSLSQEQQLNENYKAYLKESNEKNTALKTQIKTITEEKNWEATKNTGLETTQKALITAHNNALFYRNAFATSFLVSAVSFLSYYLYSRR